MMSTLTAGQDLEIFDAESGVWRLGRSVQIVEDDEYRIHYNGWSSSFDETVPASRVRVPRPLASVAFSKRQRIQTSKISDDQPPLKPTIKPPFLVKDDDRVLLQGKRWTR